MTSHSWFGNMFTRPATRPNRKAPPRCRLTLEALEDRCVPAIITVTSLADNLTADGQVTLREAIQAAQTEASVDGSTAGSGADTIVFAHGLTAGGPATINLSVVGDNSWGPSAFLVSTPITLRGPTGSNGITIARLGAAANMRHFKIDDGGDLTLENLTLKDGGGIDGAFNAPGGSIVLASFSPTARLTMLNSTLTNNMSWYGGAIDNAGGTVNLTNCTLTNNSTTSTTGGGINSYASGQVTLTNCTLSGNSARYRGGAIGNEATLTLNNCTLSGNSAAEGGADLYNWEDGTATLNNSILANSLAGANLYQKDNSTLNGSRNVIESLSIVAGTNNLTGTITDDPLLGPLQNNGGQTMTVALLPGSPAINGGNNALIPAGVTTDQRGPGFLRVFGGTVDIGAFEADGERMTTTAINAPDITYGADGVVTITVSSQAGIPTGNVELTVDGGTPITQALVGGSSVFTMSGLGAGDHSLSVSYFGQENFLDSSKTSTLHVNKAALTITANNDTKPFGMLKTFGGTAFTQTGLVAGDSITGVSQASDGAAASAAAGQYDIVASAATGTGLGNYTITYVKGTLTVTTPVVTTPVVTPPVVTIQVKKTKRVTQVIVLKDGAVHETLYPFGKKYTGKVKVLQGDYNGDGLLDVSASAKINGKKKTRTFLTV
jgi:CSLREA domain-containing protein